VRVIVCPDSFTGTLSASEAAAAMREGWLSVSPADEVVLVPLSDGGPGFASAMAKALSGSTMLCEVAGPNGELVVAEWARAGDVAFIESANACGLHLVGDSEIWDRSTTGVGQLIAHAIADGCTHIVVGLGGSGTNDAGLGALISLGARVFDDADKDITSVVARGPRAFATIARIDLTDALHATSGVTIEVATDVDNPLLGLRGASHEFSPQKGATTRDVIELEAAINTVHVAIGRRSDGKDPAVALGAGAAGGLGYGLLCLNASRTPGISRIIEAVHFRDVISNAKVILTGEGHFDWQSLRGKVINGVADAAMEYAIPVVVIAGQVSIGRRDWSAIGVSAAYAISEEVPLEQSLADAYNALRDTTARAAKTWSRA
jgi:glycerate kinase